ncbi:hypothetical protein HZB60_11125 [candidate division KSB1 bacterium]|nr:hypothetical protein [candidate division KSB1 bacterium]
MKALQPVRHCLERENPIPAGWRRVSPARRRRALGLLLLAGIVLFGVVGCPKTDEGDCWVKYPAVVLSDPPQAMLANVDSLYVFRARVYEDREHFDSLVCEVWRETEPPTSAGSFALYDDGDQRQLGGPLFASATSGDVVPNNGLYTRGIDAAVLAQSGMGAYSFVFRNPGLDACQFQDVELAISVEAVDACVIHAVTQDLDMPSCFDDYEARLTVQPDAPDVVDSAWYQILADGVVVAESELAQGNGDTTWSAMIGPSFVRCLPTRNDYSFKYVAKTRFGLYCEQGDAGLMIENALPVLSNSTLPDVIERPTEIGDTDTVVVTLDLQDCELNGATDFYGLHFDVRREDQATWPPSPTSFYLRDDGNLPDAVAGNGMYTVGLTFNRNDDFPNSMYYFRFYAIEGFLAGCAPFDTTEYFMDSVRVIQPGAVLMPPTVGAVEFGVVQEMISEGR